MIRSACLILVFCPSVGHFYSFPVHDCDIENHQSAFKCLIPVLVSSLSLLPLTDILVCFPFWVLFCCVWGILFCFSLFGGGFLYFWFQVSHALDFFLFINYLNYLLCGQYLSSPFFFLLKSIFSQTGLKYKWKTNFLELQNLVPGVVSSSE